MESGRKLRVLCLHGYRQNADIFREKSGSMRKALKKYAEFDVITAPHKANIPAAEDVGADARGWWFSRSEHHFKATDKSELDTGFNESTRFILDHIQSNGPYDGIMGFSQGACMGALLLAMCQNGEMANAIKHHGNHYYLNPDVVPSANDAFLNTLKSWKMGIDLNVKFAILAAGFVSGSSAHEFQKNTRISLPTLHIFGETDRIIPKEMSEDLAKMFDDVTFVQHSGGHYLPSLGPHKPIIVPFLQRFLM